MTKYEEIDEAASALGRTLTVFQMAANHGIPGMVLATHARIAAEQGARLNELLEAHPDAVVTIDPRLPPNLENSYRNLFGGDDEVPDFPPEDL